MLLNAVCYKSLPGFIMCQILNLARREISVSQFFLVILIFHKGMIQSLILPRP